MSGSSPSAEADSKLVSFSHVSVSANSRRIIDDIDFAIMAGEIVTIVGPNGAGKSTLLKSIIGITTPDTGHIWRKPKLHIGYVPQKLHIDQHLPLSVKRFLELAGGDDPAWISASIENSGVISLLDRQVSTLSGGEFQRVLLCRALFKKPDILIMDEPTQGLDHLGTIGFYQHVLALREQLGCAILMVSHELHVVMSESDRVICLNGHICCQGTPQQVANNPEYLAMFGQDAAGTMAIYHHQHDHHHDSEDPHVH